MPEEIVTVPVPVDGQLRTWRLVQATLRKLKHDEGRSKLIHIAQVHDEALPYGNNDVLNPSKKYYLIATESVEDANAELAALDTVMGGKRGNSLRKNRRRSYSRASQSRRRKQSQSPHYSR